MPSRLEAQFAHTWGRLYPGLPFVREVSIPPWEAWASEKKQLGLAKRRVAYRGDFVWEQAQVVVELQGGTFTVGAHSTGTGIERDCIKALTAASGGWLVLPLTAQMVGKQGHLWLPRVAAVILQRMPAAVAKAQRSD
jgi:very-short-patch-repair endonuclease